MNLKSQSKTLFIVFCDSSTFFASKGTSYCGIHAMPFLILFHINALIRYVVFIVCSCFHREKKEMCFSHIHFLIQQKNLRPTNSMHSRSSGKDKSKTEKILLLASGMHTCDHHSRSVCCRMICLQICCAIVSFGCR